MNKSLFALASGTFALGIAEFVIMAILGNVAAGLDITISQAGHLISAYAAGVTVGAPFLLFARRLPLKHIMMILAALILIGNLLAAVSTSYWGLMVARFISGFPHGCYFGVGAIVAQRIAAPGKEVSAVSMVISGMTVATIIGVPIGTLFSTYLSWRLTFVFVAMSGALAVIGIYFWIGDVGKVADTGFKGQFRFLKSAAPWLIFAGPLLGQAGLYCWYSYIEPLMTEVAGFAPDNMTWLMVLVGTAMFAGNIIGGRLSDRYKPSLMAALIQASAAVTLVAVYFLAEYRLAAVALMAIGAAQLFAPGSPLQSLIIKYSKGGELLGGATIQMAFNIGNATAAWLGGLVIAAGYGYRLASLAGLPLTLVGALLLYIMYRKYEKDDSVR